VTRLVRGGWQNGAKRWVAELARNGWLSDQCTIDSIILMAKVGERCVLGRYE